MNDINSHKDPKSKQIKKNLNLIRIDIEIKIAESPNIPRRDQENDLKHFWDG
jgi:hypothetical protein